MFRDTVARNGRVVRGCHESPDEEDGVEVSKNGICLRSKPRHKRNQTEESGLTSLGFPIKLAVACWQDYTVEIRLHAGMLQKTCGFAFRWCNIWIPRGTNLSSPIAIGDTRICKRFVFPCVFIRTRPPSETISDQAITDMGLIKPKVRQASRQIVQHIWRRQVFRFSFFKQLISRYR